MSAYTLKKSKPNILAGGIVSAGQGIVQGNPLYGGGATPSSEPVEELGTDINWETDVLEQTGADFTKNTYRVKGGKTSKGVYILNKYHKAGKYSFQCGTYPSVGIITVEILDGDTQVYLTSLSKNMLLVVPKKFNKVIISFTVFGTVYYSFGNISNWTYSES